MQVANLFITTQAQAAKTSQPAGKDVVVRASETKNSGNSFDRELSRAEAKPDSQPAPVKDAVDSVKEAVDEAVQETAAEAVVKPAGDASESAEAEKISAETVSETKDTPVDLQEAADSAAMLIALAGSAMLAQPQQTEQPQLTEAVETTHPDMAAIKAEAPVESVTELKPQALEALLPQDDAAIKQAVQNQQLINMLQQQAPTEAKAVMAEAEPVAQADFSQVLAKQNVVEQATVTAAEQPAVQVTEAQAALALNEQTGIQGRVEDSVTGKKENDNKGNILEGIPLTVEDRRTVLPQGEAQMSGDMQEQPQHNGGQQQALTNALTGEKIEQGNELPEEAAFDTVKSSTGQPAAEAVQPMLTNSFAQTIDDVPAVDQATADVPVTNDFDIPQQIIEQAKLIRNVQDTEMVIKLRPDHLGELTLKVSVTANGAINASFHSDNAQVRGIIESTMVQLKQELQEQGLKVDNIDVRTGLADNSFLGNQAGQQSGYQQSQQQPSQVRNLRADLDSFAEDAEVTAAAAPENIDRAQTVSAEGVDYMV